MCEYLSDGLKNMADLFLYGFSPQLAKINNIPRFDGADTYFPEEHSRQLEFLHSHNLYYQTKTDQTKETRGNQAIIFTL